MTRYLVSASSIEDASRYGRQRRLYWSCKSCLNRVWCVSPKTRSNGSSRYSHAYRWEPLGLRTCTQSSRRSNWLVHCQPWSLWSEAWEYYCGPWHGWNYAKKTLEHLYLQIGNPSKRWSWCASRFHRIRGMPWWSTVSPKWFPHVLLNLLTLLVFRFWCVVIIHKNIKRVKCGVDLNLDLRLCWVVVLKFNFNEGTPRLGECGVW